MSVVKCVKCGRLLTDASGRKREPIFWTDSIRMGKKKEFFKGKQKEFADIWQWCHKCYDEETEEWFSTKTNAVKCAR